MAAGKVSDALTCALGRKGGCCNISISPLGRMEGHGIGRADDLDASIMGGYRIGSTRPGVVGVTRSRQGHGEVLVVLLPVYQSFIIQLFEGCQKSKRNTKLKNDVLYACPDSAHVFLQTFQ
jgi:hypothetical protein